LNDINKIPPIINIVGRKRSGKTTLILSLLPLLSAKGYRVGTIKRTSHKETLDIPETDSFRHRKAGAAIAGFLTPSGVAAYCETPDQDAGFEILKDWMLGLDLVIVEGGKSSPGPKIEAFLSNQHSEPICSDPNECMAIVTDHLNSWPVPIFRTSELNRLIGIIEQNILHSHENDSTGK